MPAIGRDLVLVTADEQGRPSNLFRIPGASGSLAPNPPREGRGRALAGPTS
jgi:hypothetical protein